MFAFLQGRKTSLSKQSASLARRILCSPKQAILLALA
jgi:hypothetical protein